MMWSWLPTISPRVSTGYGKTRLAWHLKGNPKQAKWLQPRIKRTVLTLMVLAGLFRLAKLLYLKVLNPRNPQKRRRKPLLFFTWIGSELFLVGASIAIVSLLLIPFLRRGSECQKQELEESVGCLFTVRKASLGLEYVDVSNSLTDFWLFSIAGTPIQVRFVLL